MVSLQEAVDSPGWMGTAHSRPKRVRRLGAFTSRPYRDRVLHFVRSIRVAPPSPNFVADRSGHRVQRSL